MMAVRHFVFILFRSRDDKISQFRSRGVRRKNAFYPISVCVNTLAIKPFWHTAPVNFV